MKSLCAEYLTHAKLGDEACAKTNYTLAVSEYRLALQELQDSAEGHEHLGQALL